MSSPDSGNGGWYGLLGILASVRAEQQPPVVACPNDGEPLLSDGKGALRCPFDGYTTTATT